MRRLSLSIATTIAFTQIASAADMAVKAPPPPPPAFSWTGWYVGLNAGYDWGRSSVTSTAVPTGGLVPGVATGLAFVWHLQSRSRPQWLHRWRPGRL